MSDITSLHLLAPGEMGDFFALLAEKQVLATKDGKPYYRVTFCDAGREVCFPIWSDATLAATCREEWQAGEFYKLRAELRDTNYGLQLEIHRIRPVEEADREDGFDPLMCAARSRFDPEAMFTELMEIAEQVIDDEPLRELVTSIYEQYRDELLLMPAAQYNHHSYLSGYLEHVVNVTRNARVLTELYAQLYDELTPPINVGLAVAGAMLHDIGKLRELATGPAGATYTSAGTLIGHVLQGRDIVREAAVDSDIDEELLLRLEHIIVSHQRLPEWGAPKPPMFIEALIVHHSDDLDAKLQMMVTAISEESGEGEFTSKRNALRQPVFRGKLVEPKEEEE
ncbi:3'-5' exoribonuclease YhaM family protein [Aeoliella mucimassa]|uniref:3'-5' exoribonuclease YhaM n=1 Tax=Aeoliella mucimassa TaxID=2527972 RepID=A0A518AMH0_9BACT|nr:HD domain-containing protein [Aeoliella mucimassa]QDU55929.1 3'-5' exoribonuclease YhaM [Aeoliella mucimassa]